MHRIRIMMMEFREGRPVMHKHLVLRRTRINTGERVLQGQMKEAKGDINGLRRGPHREIRHEWIQETIENTRGRRQGPSQETSHGQKRRRLTKHHQLIDLEQYQGEIICFIPGSIIVLYDTIDFTPHIIRFNFFLCKGCYCIWLNLIPLTMPDKLCLSTIVSFNFILKELEARNSLSEISSLNQTLKMPFTCQLVSDQVFYSYPHLS